MPRLTLATILLSAFSFQFLTAQATHASKEQTSFSVEEPFSNPVELPTEVLQLLRNTDEKQGEHDILEQCAEEANISASEIPESWFEASKLTLKPGEPRALIVKAKNSCLFGAHIGSYWIFSRLPAGYQLAFMGRADALEVKTTRTNGYYDLELVFSLEGGRLVAFSRFCYRNGHYEFCGRRTVRGTDRLPPTPIP